MSCRHDVHLHVIAALQKCTCGRFLFFTFCLMEWEMDQESLAHCWRTAWVEWRCDMVGNIKDLDYRMQVAPIRQGHALFSIPLHEDVIAITSRQPSTLHFLFFIRRFVGVLAWKSSIKWFLLDLIPTKWKYKHAILERQLLGTIQVESVTYCFYAFV